MPLRIYGAKNKCLVLACNRPTEWISTSVCRTHRERRRRHIDQGRPLEDFLNEAPVRANPKLRGSLHRDDQGRKKCTICKEYKPEADYSKGSPFDGLASECKFCTSLKVRLHKYGMTPTIYWAMWHDQDGKCAICLRTFVHLRKHVSGDLVSPYVDHDHACCSGNERTCGKCTRGLLCQGCNTALGHLREDIPTMLRAVAYLNSDTVCPA